MAKKILLVEDDNNLREIYEARLMAEGYTIVTAPDGESALAVASKEKPDLVISDVMMPNISGFDMLDIMRNTEGLKKVHVIMLTALSQAEDQARAQALGADRYLVKSQVTLEDIVNNAKAILNDNSNDNSQTEPAAPAQPSAPTTEQPQAATPTTPSEPTTPAPTPEPQPSVAEPAAPPAAAEAPVSLTDSTPAPQPAPEAAPDYTAAPPKEDPTRTGITIQPPAEAQAPTLTTPTPEPVDQTASDMPAAIPAGTTISPTNPNPSQGENTQNPANPNSV